jgi:putative ABC transport system ATP-binding protein
MADQLIRVHGLARRYMMGKQEVYALNGVDLAIERGEFVALVGPSGSGKSTLLNMLGGLDRPTGGEIWVDDLELGKASDKRLVHYRRERLGFIFQSFNLLPTRTAVENVEVPLMLAGVRRRERRERALELLGRVGLGSRAHHRPNELSGGEQQRVWPSLVPSPTIRSYCLPMSRPATLIQKRVPKYCGCYKIFNNKKVGPWCW